MNTSRLFAGVAVAFSLILSIIAVSRHPVPATSQPDIIAGSVAGPTNSNGYWDYNGFQEYFLTQPFNTGTSTLCAIQTPNATTSLVAFYANVSKNFDSAGGTFYIASSTSQFATTTNYFAGTIVAGSTPGATTTIGYIATTTDATAQKWALPARSYIVFDLKGKTSYSLGGKCALELRAFQ